jgi:hypothetical protein
MIADTKMMEILADVAPHKVVTFADARTQVNQRIDMMISWLDGTRPSPSCVYEPEAFEQWCKARGKARDKKLSLSAPSSTEQQPPPPPKTTLPEQQAKSPSSPRQPILASYLDLTPEMVRRLRSMCMDGSELAEACDIFLDCNREADESSAMAADRLVTVLNQRSRSERRILKQLTDVDLLNLERDPETSPSIRWEAQIAQGRSKMRMNRSAGRRATATRLCLEYWNDAVTKQQNSTDINLDHNIERKTLP